MAQQGKSGTKTALLVTLVVLLGLVIAWHLLLPALGVAVVITGGAWGLIVGTIVALSVIGLLFFILSGLWIFILGLIAFIWTIVAIVLFPFLFPLVVPILIIVLFIGYIRRKKSDPS